MKYLDKKGKNLICIENEPTPEYWDSIWSMNDNRIKSVQKQKSNFISKITKRYIKPEDGCILEGGCGNGENVAILTNEGFKCIGVDYAKKTVQQINELWPNLDIRYANVENLPFKNGYFTGYWSLGVIEHNIDGYDNIAKEISRVVKEKGYLFLTFPYMSPVRRLKVFLKKYERISGKNFKGFYQYVLDAREVESYFNKIGFKVIKRLPLDGIKGMKDEVLFLKPILGKLYSIRSNNFFIKSVKKILNYLLTPIGGHIILLIFQKL